MSDRKMVVYNCGQFHALVTRKHSKAVDAVIEEYPILHRENVCRRWRRMIDLSSCGCKAEAIKKALAEAEVPFEDLSTPPSVEERDIPFFPQRYI